MQKINTVRVMTLVSILCAIFSIIVILIINTNLKSKEKNVKQLILNNLNENIDEVKQDEKDIIFQDGSIGIIVIPSINVNAPIYENTSQEVLKHAVGHFENTSLWDRECISCIS